MGLISFLHADGANRRAAAAGRASGEAIAMVQEIAEGAAELAHYVGELEGRIAQLELRVSLLEDEKQSS